jgi:YHS domain-containing protein
MRILTNAVVVALLLSGAAWAGEQTPPDPATFTGRITDKSYVCMMKDSMQPKAGLAHDYEGKRYWLCCEMCVQAFNENPDGIAHAKDPVNGATVDKATAPAYAFKGRAFYFSSEDTLNKFAAEPKRYVPGTS